MTKARLCSRQTCTRPAIYTLTYAYSESTAVVGPLSQLREPHAYDLCDFHAERLTAPQGWDLVRVGAAQHLQVDSAAQSTSSEESSAEKALSEGIAGPRKTYPPLRALD